MAYTTIDDPTIYFNTIAYTGDGSQDVTGVGFQPDWVWVKARGNTYNHQIHDSVRGATAGMLSSNLSDAESGTYEFDSFDSDGFTTDSGNITGVNGNTHTQVAWCWKESATAGFDIVGYTGNSSARTISHSLSAVPHLMIIKKRSQTGNWAVYHHKNTSAPATDVLYFDETNATADDTWFNDTAPTSSVFSVDGSGAVNNSGQTLIAYLFSEKQGYSKFGSYEGNGNADGPFIYTGFSPAFVIVKPIDDADNWVLLDNKRHNAINSSVAPYFLYPNRNYAETTDTKLVDFVSNGFKIRDSGNTANRTSTFIYIAFAESPLVNSNGIPNNAK
tara:strand:+ start:1514 stop:2506 length:993 start_codon:yes stop_codon:yes gene_type:complete